MTAFNDIIEIVPALHGRFFVLRHDLFVSRSMALYGEWTETEFDLVRQILRPGDTVIDVGANIGCMTVPLAQAVGPEGMVVAFEPQPGLFRLLAANTVLNALANTRLFHAACGDDSGEISIAELGFRQPDNYGAFSLDALTASASASPKSRRVPLVTLDSAIDADDPVRLIKVDVEGMEAAVLRGAERLIARHRPFLYVENENSGPSSIDLIDTLERLDYRAYWHFAPLFNPRNFRGQSQNVFADIVCVNMFCVPKEATIRCDSMQAVASSQEHPRGPRLL